MNDPLDVSPSKGNQGTTRGKEKTFDLGRNHTHGLRIRSNITLPTELRARTEEVGVTAELILCFTIFYHYFLCSSLVRAPKHYTDHECESHLGLRVLFPHAQHAEHSHLSHGNETYEKFRCWKNFPLFILLMLEKPSKNINVQIICLLPKSSKKNVI